MKKNSTSQSAPACHSFSEGGFFNLRLLIGLCIVLAGVFLALLGLGALSVITASSVQAQQRQRIIDIEGLPSGFDCTTIPEKGIDKQENLRAGLIMIACGEAEGGSASPAERFSQFVQNLLPTPLFIGGTDVDVILPDAAFPKVTQSESMEWGGPNNTWVVNYNDSRTSGGCYSGLSYSTDNGATWHASQPLCSGHGTNFGDPIVVYNARLGMWFAGDLATSCGGQGIGLWTSTDGITWTTGACAHNGGADDRESMWVDNEPTSGTYGRMYVSWNDFIASAQLSVTHSDNGTTWSAPVRLNNGSPFIRDVQLTGSPVGATRYEGANSTVFIAGMNESVNGGCGNRQNLMYKSLDGGTTWTSTTLGPLFKPICDGLCDNTYFAKVNPIIRHMGWGQPAVGPNGVVHYVYAGLGKSNSDPG